MTREKALEVVNLLTTLEGTERFRDWIEDAFTDPDIDCSQCLLDKILKLVDDEIACLLKQLDKM